MTPCRVMICRVMPAAYLSSADMCLIAAIVVWPVTIALPIVMVRLMAIGCPLDSAWIILDAWFTRNVMEVTIDLLIACRSVYGCCESRPGSR
jgi:hypothetical protein